jgi:hypothetical protein
MARIRTIKPEFWIDEQLTECSPWARLLFIGLWNFADDQGYVDDKPKRIKAQVFPNDDLDVSPLLEELVSRGRLVRYDSPVGPVLHIRTWTKHQRVDKAGKARFEETSLTPREDSRPTTAVGEVVPASLATEGKGSGSSKGSGRDLEVPPSAGDSLPLPADSVTRRSKRITDAYTAVEPMSKWPAVNGIVIRAIKVGRWRDEEIHSALLRLAAEGRPVTVESLRVELDGLPPARAAPKASTTNSRVDQALALADELERQELPR